MQTLWLLDPLEYDYTIIACRKYVIRYGFQIQSSQRSIWIWKGLAQNQDLLYRINQEQ